MVYHSSEPVKPVKKYKKKFASFYKTTTVSRNQILFLQNEHSLLLATKSFVAMYVLMDYLLLQSLSNHFILHVLVLTIFATYLIIKLKSKI